MLIFCHFPGLFTALLHPALPVRVHLTLLEGSCRLPELPIILALPLLEQLLNVCQFDFPHFLCIVIFSICPPRDHLTAVIFGILHPTL